MKCKMNEIKKKTKTEEKIEKRKDLRIVKLQKEEDILMKILIEEMSVIHIYQKNSLKFIYMIDTLNH